jgi:DNA primase
MSPPEVGLGRIPDRVIEEIRERADVVQVVGRYVNLKRSGSRYWGLCPFHSEKTPSFQVHPDKQIYHCFGCGEGGDVFSFRMRHDGTDFLDTVRALAQEFGIEIPRTSGDRQERTAPLYELNDLALSWFRRNLRGPAGAPARRYLEQRNVPADLIDRFQLGFAPAGWDGLLGELRQKRESLERATEAGLIAARQTGDGHYDRFRSRLVFPITEPTGRVVGFGGRALADETPKYLNSPESPIYRKGRALFGLALAVDAIRQKGRAIVVEGYFDLIALHRAGLQEGVAPCGTAITPDHARRLRRYTREVVLLFDGDEAGQRAAERSLPVLTAVGLRVRAAFLAPGDDPDTLLEREGAGALVACVDESLPLIEHLIDERLGMKPLREWEAADLAASFADLLAAIPEDIERAGYEKRIASRLEMQPSTVALALREKATRSARPARAETAPIAVPGIDPVVRTLLGAVGSYPELASLLDELPPQALPAGESGVLLRCLADTLRERGAEGIAWLVSPASEALPEQLKPALSQALTEGDPGDKAKAERAVRDCVADLRIAALDRELEKLRNRLGSCSDRQEEDAVLRETQHKRLERAGLRDQLQEG